MLFVGNSGLTINIDESATALEIFQQFLTKTLLDKVNTETNLYASQNLELSSSTRHDVGYFYATPKELKVLFAPSLMMGIVKKPDAMMYWGKDDMVETLFFPKLFQAIVIENC